jgi:hypothetical protein
MNNDYAKDTAAGQPVTIGGKEYRAAKFGPRSLGDLTAWLKKQVPDPRLQIRELCEGLGDGVALQIWRDLQDAAQDWPPSLLTPEGNLLLTGSSEGAAQVIWVSLRKHQPYITLEKALEMALDIENEELFELIRLGFPEGTFVPKVEPKSKEVEPPEMMDESL